MKKEIKIPEIAENVEKGVIVGILVAKGDKVKADQALVEIETDKATTDLSSPYEGVIEEIKVKEGDEVKVNQVIMIVETEGDEAGSGDAVVGSGSEEQEEDNDKEENTVQEEDSGKEETKDQDEGDKEEDKLPENSTKEKSEPNADEEQPPEESEQNETESGGRDLSDIPASPSVRRLAREQGIDLTKVKGSGPGNRISAEDIKSYSEKPAASVAKEAKLPDFAKWGPVSSEAMTNIRKITSRNVQQAWQIIPHVTQFDEADMTNLENFRKNNQDKVEREGGKLTVTAILLKIAGFALLKFPRFNASLDTQNEQIIYKHYVNIGIAADTPQGLLVPVVRDVNKKSLTELSVELTELAQKARDKKISLDELQGGNFTISNLGGIGGTNFTPIVLLPQVAILGVSRAKYQQVFVDDEFQKRLIIPLSLSYDHRVIDGADGVRFLRWICEVIEDPYALLQ
jgi:pyruvate dehydrogenase E2 component (dihydrolipoamide acetyltransferase)